MATLFAAHDAAGNPRYIGDVARGAACGCFCPVCNSPLVAKQGNELDWHFAHEAGTELPECRAGAVNLLRRLAIEDLARRGPVLLPVHSVPHPLAGRVPIEWSAHASGELRLLDAHDPHGPAARLSLREGGAADIFVCIDRESPPAPGPAQHAALLLWCPLPQQGEIRTDDQARAFVRSCSRLTWITLPDFTGRVAAAQAEARQFMERLQRERAHQAGARWAAHRRALAAARVAGIEPALERVSALEPAPHVSRGSTPPAWAPGLMPGSSIHFRILDDGSQWVCFQHAPRQWRLCPVPHPHDGWDECFPPTIAVPEGNTWLRVVDFSKLLMVFNAHATVSEIDSDPEVIAQRFRA